MTIWKRVKRLWTLLTTGEYFDERGSLGRRTTGLDPNRQRSLPGRHSACGRSVARQHPIGPALDVPGSR